MSGKAHKAEKPAVAQPLVTILRMVKDHPIKKMKPWERNPRHNDEAVIAVERSLGRFGAVAPIILDEKGRICAGETRYKAAVQVGLKTFPAVVCRFADDAAFAGYNIADNQTASIADWDIPGLEAIVKELEVSGVKIEDLGFDETGFRELLESIESPDLKEGNTGPDDIPEPSKKAITKPGDLYVLGDHRLLCGDCTAPEDLKRLMNGEVADLLSTDPPYLIGYKGDRMEGQGKDWSASYDDVITKAAKNPYESYDIFLTAILPHIKKHAGIYIWHAERWLGELQKALGDHAVLWHQLVIWHKPRLTLTRTLYLIQHEVCSVGWLKGNKPSVAGNVNDRSTVWQCDWNGKSNIVGNEHPTEKPVGLFTIPIQYHTTPKAICLEPFCGSGTQIIAAEQTGRRCFAMERAPIFCDVIVKRWEEFTGKKAKRYPAKGHKGK